MLIDWFTVGAQVLNFLILVWLLKRFLYKPVLDAIGRREKRIADELAGADTKKAEAQKEHDEFDGKNKVFDDQKASLFAKVEADAKAEHDRLIDDAHKEAYAFRAAQAAALKVDSARLSAEITRAAADEVFGIARKTLQDLATASLEERITEVFTRRLHQLEPAAKDAMGKAIFDSSDSATLRSTFDPPADQKAAIQNALNETFSANIRVSFETAPETVCGIELIAGGQKIDWTIKSHLDSLGAKVGLLMDGQQTSEAK